MTFIKHQLLDLSICIQVLTLISSVPKCPLPLDPTLCKPPLPAERVELSLVSAVALRQTLVITGPANCGKFETIKDYCNVRPLFVFLCISECTCTLQGGLTMIDQLGCSKPQCTSGPWKILCGVLRHSETAPPHQPLSW